MGQPSTENPVGLKQVFFADYPPHESALVLVKDFAQLYKVLAKNFLDDVSIKYTFTRAFEAITAKCVKTNLVDVAMEPFFHQSPLHI